MNGDLLWSHCKFFRWLDEIADSNPKGFPQGEAGTNSIIHCAYCIHFKQKQNHVLTIYS